jgi:hypothetical protein
MHQRSQLINSGETFPLTTQHVLASPSSARVDRPSLRARGEAETALLISASAHARLGSRTRISTGWKSNQLQSVMGIDARGTKSIAFSQALTRQRRSRRINAPLNDNRHMIYRGSVDQSIRHRGGYIRLVWRLCPTILRFASLVSAASQEDPQVKQFLPSRG